MIRSSVKLCRYLVAKKCFWLFVRHSVLRSFFDDRDARRPIFMMSTSSSGSTWIAALLGHLRSHVFIHEVKLYRGRSRYFWKLLLLSRAALPGRLLYVLFEAFERARLWTVWQHCEYMGDRPELIAMANVKSLDPVSPHREHAKYDVIDSAGGQLNIASLLRRAYPNAILCYVLRDPRDAILSIVHRKPFGKLRTIDGWAENYVRSYLSCKKQRGPCDIDVIRYEDWLDDTQGQMRAFLDRHQLVMTEDELRVTVYQHDAKIIQAGLTARVGNLSVAKAGNWKNALTPEDKRRIKPILDDVLIDSGYETSNAW